jgi:hydrogenase maturation factor HypF (carbamoyltransferase family)
MIRLSAQAEIHLCPDCQTHHAHGEDRFGQPMPCTRCVVKRLVKAMEADLEDQRQPAACAV